MRYLETEEIIAINKQVISLSKEQHAILEKNKIESAVYRHKHYVKVHEVGAALMHSLMNNHPFEQGNKRTALLAAQTILESEGYRFSMDPVKLADRVESMVKDHWEFEKIAAWLRRRINS